MIKVVLTLNAWKMLLLDFSWIKVSGHLYGLYSLPYNSLKLWLQLNENTCRTFKSVNIVSGSFKIEDVHLTQAGNWKLLNINTDNIYIWIFVSFCPSIYSSLIEGFLLMLATTACCHKPLVIRQHNQMGCKRATVHIPCLFEMKSWKYDGLSRTFPIIYFKANHLGCTCAFFYSASAFNLGF